MPNYKFRKTLLSDEECAKILSQPNNVDTMRHAHEKIKETQDKAERT